jgi:hypothetical protein
MPIEFHVGMALDINEECLGTITQVTDDRICIESEAFTGWATKAEISEAIESLTTAEQSLDTLPQRPAFAL